MFIDRIEDATARALSRAVISTLLIAPISLAQGRLLPHLTPTAGSISSAQNTNEIRQLEPSKPLERQMAGGESHSYHVSLAAGHYLHVVIMQKGIDVVATLLSPGGDQIVEMDSPNGTDGPEHVWAIAEAPGIHRLVVRSIEKEVTAGSYLVRIAELRTATTEDHKRVAGELAYAEAELLLTQGTAESLARSIEKYQIALPLWRELNDRRREADTLNNISYAYGSLSEFHKDLEYQQQALAVRRALGDRPGEGDSLHSIGSAYASLGEVREGIEHYRQALEVFNRIGDRGAEARVLWNLGSVYNLLGETQQALNRLHQSLSVSRAIGNRTVEANALHTLGNSYLLLGDFQTALDYFNQARSIRHERADRGGEAEILASIGWAHANLKEHSQALEYLSQSLQSSRSTGNRYIEAENLRAIGSIHQGLNDNQKALEYYKQSLALKRAIGDRLGEAFSLTRVGDTYSRLAEHQKAIDLLNQALSLHQAVGSFAGETLTLYCLAQANQRLGNLQEARTGMGGVLDRLDSAREKRSMTQDLRSSFFALVQGHYEFYIELLMQMHSADPKAGHDQEALTVSERARARGLLDLLNETRADIRQGVDGQLLDRERRLRELVTAKLDKLTALLSGKHRDAQKVAAEKEIAALINEHRQVQAEIRQRSPHYAALTQPRPLKAQDIQQTLLDSDTLLLEYAFGQENIYLWLVSPTSISSYKLGKRNEVEATARRVHELLTARQDDSALAGPELRTRIAEADAKYRAEAPALSRMLLGPVASQLGTKRLLIVAPGALQYLPFSALPLPVEQRTIVSSETPGKGDKAAANGLQVTGQYQSLVVEHEIISLPSASVLAVMRHEASRPAATKMVAVMADPVFTANDPRVNAGPRSRQARLGDPSGQRLGQQAIVETPSDLERALKGVNRRDRNSLSRLPFTQEEAEAIFATTPNSSGLKALGFKANRATATSDELGQYRIVHFATHGLLNSERPELSGLVLSLVDEAGRSQNGFLRLHEIYNLKLSADLVVLSACQTALGKEIKGEGLVGLTRGFMYAGAPRVVASLWQVDDLATADLMGRFYRGMLQRGMRPAAALRAAQMEILKQKRWQAPYYWAGFVLQGEWR